MDSPEAIQKAIEQLSLEELAEFRAWFEPFDAVRFDAKIERDIQAGTFEGIAEEALRSFHQGRTRES